jgi:hypothetical protein
MLTDQKLYNTTEMLRKKHQSTRVVDHHQQSQKIKEAKRNFMEEQKYLIKAEAERKQKLEEFGKMNLGLAQQKLEMMRATKQLGRSSFLNLDNEREKDYLENGLKLLEVNQQRFKEKVCLYDMRNNGRLMGIQE